MSTVLARHGAFMLEADAKLAPHADVDVPDGARSWFITHGLGKPAGGTFTEVVIDGTPEDDDGAPLPVEVVEQLVREIAVQLYGTAWAFTYRPDQYADAIGRHGMRRRELVLVDALEVLS